MKISKFGDVVDHYQAIFLDAYGVLKNSQGIIPGVQATIDYLKATGKPFYILTNDASRSPRQMVLRYQEQGLEGIEIEHIISSGMMAYAYLSNTVKEGRVAYLGTKSSADYMKLDFAKTVSIMNVHPSDISDISAVAFFDDEGFDWQIALNKTINILRQLTVPVVVAN